MIDLDTVQARRLAVISQGFGTRTDPVRLKSAIVALIERAAYIQIDTISVLKRAHHHSLWNRERAYREALLDELQQHDRLIFEYWGHAASYLPMADYRFYLPLMSRFVDTAQRWFAERLALSRDHLQPVLAAIRAEGPKSARDFESRPARPGGWWEWKPAKAALEVLFWRGELMVSHRCGFQKVYDLPERVLPDWVDTRRPTRRELNRFLVRRALKAHGLVTADDAARFLFGGDRKELRSSLEELVEEGAAMRCRLRSSQGNEPVFVDRLALDRLNAPQVGTGSVVILSPFDNLVINRDRLRRLFAFDYTVECYVPAAKRRFGYFALPILYGCDLVGRIDLKADRPGRRLIVNALHFEDGFEQNEAFCDAFTASLRDFAAFNDCDESGAIPGIAGRGSFPVTPADNASAPAQSARGSGSARPGEK